MAPTQDQLNSIKWNETTFFPQDSQLVLVCGNEAECGLLLTFMNDNSFSFLVGENEDGQLGFILKFNESNAQMHFIPHSKNLLKYMNNGLIKYLTTGFPIGENDISCQSLEIELDGFNYNTN